MISQEIRDELAKWKAREADLAAQRAEIDKMLEAARKVVAALTEMEAMESPFSARYRPKGRVSVRGASIKVLKEAGRPLHVSEIWKLIEAMGAVSNAREPHAAVDFTLTSAQKNGVPVEKLPSPPRTWKWVGE